MQTEVIESVAKFKPEFFYEITIEEYLRHMEVRISHWESPCDFTRLPDKIAPLERCQGIHEALKYQGPHAPICEKFITISFVIKYAA